MSTTPISPAQAHAAWLRVFITGSYCRRPGRTRYTIRAAWRPAGGSHGPPGQPHVAGPALEKALEPAAPAPAVTAPRGQARVHRGLELAEQRLGAVRPAGG